MKRSTIWLLVVASLGYFVDVFDLLLFSVVRNKSLLDIGVAADSSLSVGLRLLNFQMAGLLLGGLLWGVLGDKRGRLSVLFGSILLYSLANLANAFVAEVWQYEVLRFLAGIGLAGELGAGITIVSEVMSKEKRGYGGMLVAAVGLTGAIVAGWVGQHYAWRSCYMAGGIMGLVLLALRIGVAESGLYKKVLTSNVGRGSLLQLFGSRRKVGRYLLLLGVGFPTYYVVGLLITGSPEFGKALGMSELPVAGSAVMFCYIGLTIGDLVCTTMSQILGSRRAAFFIFNALLTGAILWFLLAPSPSLDLFYWKCGLMGFCVGYWALITINATEQFGTNLRASVATSIPNFVRAATIPISFFFEAIRGGAGVIGAALWVGLGVMIIAFTSTYLTKETFGRDLDFVEE